VRGLKALEALGYDIALGHEEHVPLRGSSCSRHPKADYLVLCGEVSPSRPDVSRNLGRPMENTMGIVVGLEEAVESEVAVCSLRQTQGSLPGRWGVGRAAHGLYLSWCLASPR
jgi:hypothetical protein